MKFFFILLLLSSYTMSYAASTRVNLSIIHGVFMDFSGTPLTAGTSGDGDGTILQLGYYTASTALNPFAGDWIEMTGPGTPFPTTIGDSGDQGSGSFKLEILFTQGSYSFIEPAVGTPLALRFYDATSIAAATYFNAVSDTTGGFNWAAPSEPESQAGLSLTFLSAGVVWQGGVGSAYHTTIIPEPNFALLACMGGLGALAVRRRRQQSRVER